MECDAPRDQSSRPEMSRAAGDDGEEKAAETPPSLHSQVQLLEVSSRR